MALQQMNQPYVAGSMDDDFSEEESSLLDATATEEEQEAQGGEFSPNKDELFMHEYSIQDNLAYTVAISVSQYSKIVTLTYALLGGLSDSIVKKIAGLYIAIGISLFLVRLNNGTNISPLSYILSIGITIFIYSKLNDYRLIGESEEEEEDDQSRTTDDKSDYEDYRDSEEGQDYSTDSGREV